MKRRGSAQLPNPFAVDGGIMRSLGQAAPEVFSLVHHVQLNDPAWRDQMLQRLVLGVLWHADAPLDRASLTQRMSSLFGIEPRHGEMESTLSRLTSQELVVTSDLRISLTPRGRERLGGDLARGEEIDRRVRERFAAVFQKYAVEFATPDFWERLQSELLIPLVASIGARTYQLVVGEGTPMQENVSVHRFLQTLSPSVQPAVRDAIRAFVDPADDAMRAYLLRMMNAYFVIEGCAMSQESLGALAAKFQTKPNFTVFVDTNFILSRLGMHSDEARDAAERLVALVESVADHANVKLAVLPPTVDETCSAIQLESSQLGGQRWTPKLALAALKTASLGDLGRHFATECVRTQQTMRPSDYFAPYISTPIATLRSQGLTLHNASFEAYEDRADVNDDVERLFRLQQKTGKRSKSRAQIRHDMLLWHYTRDRRAARVDSPLDAAYWVLTEDFSLVGFDEAKRRKDPSEHPVPICVHPLTLLQMLQFWAGRSPALEDAMLSSLRLSFLFQDFDAHAERVTLKIIDQLAMIESVQRLPQEVIVNTLVSDAIRARVDKASDAAQEARVVRDALVAEFQDLERRLNEVSSERDQLKNRVESAEHSKVRAELDLAAAEDHNKQLATAVREKAAAAAIEQKARVDAETARATIARDLDDLKEKVAVIDQERSEAAALARTKAVRSSYVLRYLVGGFVLTCGAIGIAVSACSRGREALLGAQAYPNAWKIYAGLGTGIALCTYIEIAARRVAREPALSSWRLGRRIVEWRSKFIGVVVGGVIINLLSNLIAWAVT